MKSLPNSHAASHRSTQLSAPSTIRPPAVLEICLNAENDSRNHRRVKVGLQGALRIPGVGVKMVRSMNLSEGGVLLKCSETSELNEGEEVQLHLDGIVSGGAENRLITYRMRVVWRSRRLVALRFV